MCLLNPMMFQILALLGGKDIEETVTGVIDESGSFGGIGQDVTNVGNGIVGIISLIGLFVLVICLMVGAIMLGASGLRGEGKERILSVIFAAVLFGAAVWIIARSMGIGSGFSQKGQSGSDTKTIVAPLGE